MALAALAAGCSKRPEKVLPESKMVDFLTDMIVADAYEQSAGSSMPDSLRRTLGERVMKAHGIDRETLDSTYAWYSRNLDDYAALYSKVDKRLLAERKKQGGSGAPESEGNDIWPLPPHVMFTPMAASDALIMEVPGETLEKGERVEWKMRLSTPRKVEMTLGVEYTDGSSTQIVREFSSDRKPTVTLNSDTGRVARRIYGVVEVKRESMPLWADSIQLNKLPFDSTQYSNSWSQKYYSSTERQEK